MKYFFFILLFSTSLWASNEPLISFDNGQVNIGQKNIKLGLSNFKIIFDHISPNIRASFLRDSLHWTRTEENIYTPTAEMLIQLRANIGETPHLVFEGQTYTPSSISPKVLTFNLTVPLFKYTDIKLFSGTKQLNTIKVSAIPHKGVKSHHIDSSCSPYKLEVLNFNNQYLSLFCKLEKLGSFGKERPKLKVYWTTPNFTLSGQNASLPYVTTFTTSSIANFSLVDNSGKKQIMTLKVTLPKRLHRIKTALGVGPYKLKTKDTTTQTSDLLVADITLYGKIDLATNSSIRFFDSYAQKSQSLFNNFGLYFAYDLANIYNGNINVVALLGFQHILYDHPGHTERTTQFITPQGAEMSFKHPFGLKNWLLGGGGFFSIKESITYKNIWIRFGKKLMVELNYIEWGYENEYAEVYGLSFIYPLASFF